MGFPKPWPTTWPDPVPDPPDDDFEPEPDEEPVVLPEDHVYAVTWAVTHACNLTCSHCYDVVPQARRSLGTEDARRVLEQLRRAGVEFVAFSGGEPFARRDLLELMAHARRLGMRFGARSNGTLITEAVAQRLRDLGASVVGVSFDGATASTHDAVRGAGSFAASLEGVRNLARAGVRAQIEVVLSRANVAEALDFVAVGERAGAKEVNFSALTPNGRGAERRADLLDPALRDGLVARLRSAARTSAVSVTPNCAFEGPCVVNVEPHLTCDGWVSPCYLSKEKLFHILEIDPGTFARRLLDSRPRYLDVCGRREWAPPNARLPVVV